MYSAYLTGSGALSNSLTPNFAFKLKEVRLHLGGTPATAEDFTMNLDSYLGTEYDVNLITQSMASASDLVIVFETDRNFNQGDIVDFAYLNTGTKTMGLEVTYDKTSAGGFSSGALV